MFLGVAAREYKFGKHFSLKCIMESCEIGCISCTFIKQRLFGRCRIINGTWQSFCIVQIHNLGVCGIETHQWILLMWLKRGKDKASSVAQDTGIVYYV